MLLKVYQGQDQGPKISLGKNQGGIQKLTRKLIVHQITTRATLLLTTMEKSKMIMRKNQILQEGQAKKGSGLPKKK